MSLPPPLFPKPVVILLSFDRDGAILTSSPIPTPPSPASLASAVKMFLSSVSIATALPSSPSQPSVAQSQPITSVAESPVHTVTFDLNSVIIGQSHPSGSWLALIINPFCVHQHQILHAILPAFLQAAYHLVHLPSEHPNHHHELYSHVFALWSSISACAGQLVAWERHKSVSQVAAALIHLSYRHTASFRVSSASIHQDSDHRRNHLQPLYTKLYCQLNQISAPTYSAYCVITPDFSIWCSHNITTRQQQSILWYYQHFITAHSQASSPTIFELPQAHSARLWFKRRGYTLCIQLCSKASATARHYASLRPFAADLLRAVEVYSPT
eukprot:GFKZ01012704.1.p1 GENE.GFKZ01012704.1~~GFKZ01012704.1.p1  ORF type:complete len:327 (+),score=19.65 GFKZ01012704.1:342-1322(+)